MAEAIDTKSEKFLSAAEFVMKTENVISVKDVKRVEQARKNW